MKPFLARVAIRSGLFLYGVVLRAVRTIAPRRRTCSPGGCTILLTGAFQSEAWVEHHLLPLARSTACASITMVAAAAMPAVAKVTVVCPPRWLQTLVGSAPARLLQFGWLALRRRPDIVGGFHLLFNGLMAGMVAPVVGARSLYFCVGGPIEIVDGGISAENKVFNKLGTADPIVERQLTAIVRAFDIIITMGSGAARFFRDRGVTSAIHVIPGGVDRETYRPSTLPPTTDLIFVGRLAPIKGLDLLLEAMLLAKSRLPGISLAIIGDGELRGTLETSIRALGLSSNITLAGQRADVNEWMARSRLFVLTSHSEGVSLSLMEACASGLPAIVTDVGDLGDVVTEGVNGYLVAGRSAEALANRIVELLRDEPRRQLFAAEALRASRRFQVESITRLWDDVFAPPAAQTGNATLPVRPVTAGRRP